MVPEPSTICESPLNIVDHPTPGSNGVSESTRPTCCATATGAPTIRAIVVGASPHAKALYWWSRAIHSRITGHVGPPHQHDPPKTTSTLLRSRLAVRERPHSNPMTKPTLPKLVEVRP